MQVKSQDSDVITKKAKLVEQEPSPKNDNERINEVENAPQACSPERMGPEISYSLSPEQKTKMDANRLNAKIKLTEKQTHGIVTNIGTSWYKALEPEFSKPYFVKVLYIYSAQI